MEKYLEVIRKCPLFNGIDKMELTNLLNCLNANQKSVKKEENIFRSGSRADLIGIVLSGSVYIYQEDYWGNRTILTTVQTGGLFGEAFSCAESDTIPVSVAAKENSAILLINCNRMITTCSSSCVFHAGIIRNLMKIIAKKNIQLTKRIEIFTRKTVKEKVLCYLSECAISEGKNSFSIPYNRQELADYLSVERSALSATLGKMRDENIIKFDKNKFWLLD